MSGSRQDRQRVYFTWPDRGLRYECAGCGACCKGLGIGLDAAGGQVERLVSLYPEVATFVRKRGATWTAFNPRGRCWFLDGDGLCRVERDHGRDVKPASCRLFPFNRIFRLGSWTIVDFNSVICPLQPAPEGDGASHEEVWRDVLGVADPAVVGTSLPGDDPETEGRALVTRERGIAEACFAGDLARAWAAQSDEPLAEASDALSIATEVVLGMPARRPTGEALRRALLLVPSMRFNERYGPRPWTSAGGEMLPRLVLGWLHAVAVGAELAGRAPTLQEQTTIWSEIVPLAYAFARWNDAPSLAPGATLGRDAPRQARAFARACRGDRTVGQILAPLVADLPVAERVAAVRGLDPLWPHIRFS